tara:strand:- start:932 stop:1582 length:651 start_codon:yes stop_codon:yes gene_type:complete
MKQVNGLWLPDSDTHFSGPDYEIGTRQVVLGLTKERRLALDVGAHVGIWTCHLADEFGEVISLEPNPENFECLQKNTEGMDNVTLRNEGASWTSDMMTLVHNREGNSGMWSLAMPGEKVPGHKSHFVKVITIDSLALPDLDLIKIDAEGHEPGVLRGAMSTIERCRPVLCMEVKGNGVAYSIVTDALYQAFAEFSFDYEPHRVGSEIIYTPEKNNG